VTYARGEIENLMALYTEALDEARFADLGVLFAHGTVTIEGGPQHGSRAQGEAAVAGLYASIVAVDADGKANTRHFITNVFVAVDAATDAAVGRSYFAVTQQTADLPLQIVACGAYHDTYEVAHGQWRFMTRHIVCDQVGNLTQHML
jgi:hypothetical protein